MKKILFIALILVSLTGKSQNEFGYIPYAMQPGLTRANTVAFIDSTGTVILIDSARRMTIIDSLRAINVLLHQYSDCLRENKILNRRLDSLEQVRLQYSKPRHL